MQIPRFYADLALHLKPGKILVIYGPRQTGKTTLVQNFLSKYPGRYKLDSGDNLRTQTVLSSQNFDTIKEYTEGYQLIIIDDVGDLWENFLFIERLKKRSYHAI